MSIAAIVAVDEDGAIGKDGIIPWRLSADMAHFKQTTMGHPVIMGRKTYESIGKALPGRLNIVVTRDKNYRADGVEAANSVDAAIAMAKEHDQQIFIIGGAEIYKLALAQIDRIYLTYVHTHSGGDRFFDYDAKQWQEVSREAHKRDDKNQFDYDFIVLEH